MNKCVDSCQTAKAKRGLLAVVLAAIIAGLIPGVYAYGDEPAPEVSENAIFAIYYGNPDGKTYTLVVQRGDKTVPTYSGLTEKVRRCVCSDMNDEYGGCDCSAGLYEEGVSQFVTHVVIKPGVRPHTLRYWFDGYSRLASIDLTGLDSSRATSVEGMFSQCSSLEVLDMSMLEMPQASLMDPDMGANQSGGLFAGCESLKEVHLPKGGFPSAKSFADMFFGCSALETVDISPLGTAQPVDLSGMFARCESLRTVDLKTLDMTKVESMGPWRGDDGIALGMFEGCSSLESINLSRTDMPALARMGRCFADCVSLREVDLSHLSAPQLQTVECLFAGCEKLERVVTDGLSMPALSGVRGMFLECSSLKNISLKGFDFSKVEDFAGVFSGCCSLEEIDLSTVHAHWLDLQSAGAFDDTGAGHGGCDENAGMLAGCRSLRKITVGPEGKFAGVFPGDLVEYDGEDENGSTIYTTYETRRWVNSHGEKHRSEEIPAETAGVYELERTCQYPIEGCYIRCTDSTDRWNYAYTGRPICPKFSVSWWGASVSGWEIPARELQEGIDYVIEYRDNVVLGSAVAVIRGTGDWTGSHEEKFYINDTNNIYVDPNDNDIADGYMELSSSSFAYTGSAIKPSVTVRWYGRRLVSGTDYTVTYRDNVKPGYATVLVTGRGKYRGTLSSTFYIEESYRPSPGAGSGDGLSSGGTGYQIPLSQAKVTVADRTWTGKTLYPSKVTVKLGGKTLRQGTDYTVSCAGGKAVGSYRVAVTGKGSYAGTKTATFKIVPKGASVKKLAKAKRGFTVTWKKPSKAALKQTTGYQVRYSLKKSMKGAKTKTVKASSKAGKKCQLKVSKLKDGKKYYVQVRTYKKVGKATYYSSWSKAKAVKTRK